LLSSLLFILLPKSPVALSLSFLFLRVKSDEAVLTHQEHHDCVLPKGDYQIGIVQEYDHFLEEARHVAD
jgi:hypothetical protein